MNLDREIAPLIADMTAWRRHLPQHRGTGFEEVRTSAFAIERRCPRRIEIRTGIGGTRVETAIRDMPPVSGAGDFTYMEERLRGANVLPGARREPS